MYISIREADDGRFVVETIGVEDGPSLIVADDTGELINTILDIVEGTEETDEPESTN